MWIAVRNLEERTALYRELAERARAGRRPLAAELYEGKLKQAGHAAEVIRGLLSSGELGFGTAPATRPDRQASGSERRML